VADRDFLEEIKETEARAVLLVEKAREEAQLTRQAARQQASDRVAGAYQLAASRRQEKMEEAQARYRDLVEGKSAAQISGSPEFPQSLLDQAAAALAERIIDLLEHR
jgi:vacuolar-type H+-ATPase subunit H